MMVKKVKFGTLSYIEIKMGGGGAMCDFYITWQILNESYCDTHVFHVMLLVWDVPS